MGIQINGQTDTIKAIDGTMTMPGTVTYEDVSRVNVTGIITAGQGLHVTNGNVAIGPITATDKLTIAGGGIDIADNASVNFGSNHAGGATILYNPNGNLDITPRTNYHTVFTSGNVAIGTDNPLAALHVENAGSANVIINNSSNSSGLVFEGTTTTGEANIRTRYSNSQLTFSTLPSSGPAEVRLRITSDGELLIGDHTSGPSNTTPKIEAREDGTSATWRGLINSSNNTADKSAFLGIFGTRPVVAAHDRDMTAWDTLYLNTTDPLTTNNGGDVYTGGKFAIGTDSPGGYTFVCEKRDASATDGVKNLVAKFINTAQNTLELNMYGGATDQVQFAATNSEQTLSFLTGVNSGNVDSTETTLLMTQSRDLWAQGPNSGTTGGGLFIGREASPYGNLCALRDSNRRPLIYMSGAYPEITLAHTVATNVSHGPTLRFATYVQSTNTATGNQFVIGTNGTGTFLDIGHAAAAQNQNVHSGIANYNGNYRLRVTTSGCEVNGTFSVSSTKNFKIPHPLVGLTTTTHLYHTTLEGPQADLIYRGVVDLVDGSATVNIDTAARMTEGTFEVLCNNVSCFTSNETDWTAVKGSVSGNILTITAQDNTSTASVSWMVVGERKDQDMIDCHLTDDNGRLITEHNIDPDS